MSEIFCPKCGSSNIHTAKKGYSIKKGILGGLLFGRTGLLAGAIGKDDVIMTCLECGHQFKPGEGSTTNTAKCIEETKNNNEQLKAKLQESQKRLAKLKDENFELTRKMLQQNMDEYFDYSYSRTNKVYLIILDAFDNEIQNQFNIATSLWVSALEQIVAEKKDIDFGIVEHAIKCAYLSEGDTQYNVGNIFVKLKELFPNHPANISWSKGIDRLSNGDLEPLIPYKIVKNDNVSDSIKQYEDDKQIAINYAKEHYDLVFDSSDMCTIQLKDILKQRNGSKNGNLIACSWLTWVDRFASKKIKLPDVVISEIEEDINTFSIDDTWQKMIYERLLEKYPFDERVSKWKKHKEDIDLLIDEKKRKREENAQKVAFASKEIFDGVKGYNEEMPQSVMSIKYEQYRANVAANIYYHTLYGDNYSERTKLFKAIGSAIANKEDKQQSQQWDKCIAACKQDGIDLDTNLVHYAYASAKNNNDIYKLYTTLIENYPQHELSVKWQKLV